MNEHTKKCQLCGLSYPRGDDLIWHDLRRVRRDQKSRHVVGFRIEPVVDSALAETPCVCIYCIEALRWNFLRDAMPTDPRIAARCSQAALGVITGPTVEEVREELEAGQ